MSLRTFPLWKVREIRAILLCIALPYAEFPTAQTTVRPGLRAGSVERPTPGRIFPPSRNRTGGAVPECYGHNVHDDMSNLRRVEGCTVINGSVLLLSGFRRASPLGGVVSS